MSEYIRKEDVLNLPQSIERNLCGEIVERSIDVKDIESLKPADVVPVVRCRNCAGCEYDTALDQYWCTRGRLIIGRHVMPDDFCSYGKRREE